MEGNKALKEQIDLYPRFSQEDIVALYKSEEITEETVAETLENLNSLIDEKKFKLSLLEEGSAEDRLLHAVLVSNDKESKKIKDLRRIIAELNKKVEEFYVLQQEMTELFTPTEVSNNTISTIIEKLNQEIEVREQALVFEEKKSAEEDVEKKQKIKDLREQLEKLVKQKSRLKNYAHIFNMGTRGIVPKNRKFPSNELRNEIICGTLWYAKYLSKLYYYKSDNKIPFDDLFQVASETLMSAAHYYVPSNRATFYTYARRCIENKLRHEIYGKKKKRSINPTNFFQKEKDIIKYVKMFLVSSKINNSNKNSTYEFEKYLCSMSVELSTFKHLIREHNREMLMREESYRSLPSFSKKSQNLNSIVQNIARMLKETKMNVLITEEDRQLANLVINYQNKPLNAQEFNQLIYLLNSYLLKLDFIDKYIKAERTLITENDGITPTDEEILEQINKNIRLENQERYKLKKEGLFENFIIYRSYYDFYNEYKELYKVDPFVDPSEYMSEGYSSKQKERDDIIQEFYGEELDTIICTLDYMAKSISFSRSEKIILYSYEQSNVYCDFEEYDENEQYCDGEVYTRQEAVDKIKTMREILPQLVEEHVKKVLKERKDKVNDILQKKNAPIVEENRKIKIKEDKRALGSEYQRYINENKFEEIKHDIELLFNDDEELMLMISSDGARDKRKSSKYLLLEDEALDNLFLEDYHTSLNDLQELEREVLLKYFDENGVHSMTAKEIGAELGIPQGQVYKVKTKALKKLRKNPKMQSYKENNA